MAAGQNVDLIGALADLEQERGIDRETLLEAVEAALISAYRRNYGTTENVAVHIDRNSGQMDIYVSKRIVDEVADPDQEIGIDEAQAFDPSYQTGDIIEFPVLVKDFGRIAAQTAKQVVVQRLREAERGMIYDEYAQREGDIITGLVQRVQGRTAFMDLGKAEAVLPAAEVPPGEYYNPGDRVKVYLVEVRRTNKGPQLLVSRTHPGLLKRLFELEVPEIHDGLVEVKGIAREAGARSKLAVYSREEHVDPVGACVGHKGMRVQAVVNELRGEKIDIVKWSPDPLEYVANALSPSKVSQVILREEDKVARVIVPDYQLSLAIGRAGQNARLAAKLTGWRIDIRSESQVLEEGGEIAPVAPLGTPAIPWAGGLAGVRSAPILAPWASPGAGAAEAGAPEPAAAESGANESVAVEAGASEPAAPEPAPTPVAAGETAPPVEAVPAAAAASGEAPPDAPASGEPGAESEPAAPKPRAAAVRAQAVKAAAAGERAKPKKRVTPKHREEARVVHAGSLADALAQAGLAEAEKEAEGAAAATEGASRSRRSRRSAPKGPEAAGAEAVGEGASTTAEAVGENASAGSATAEAGAAVAREPSGRRRRSRVAEPEPADEDAPIDAATLEALEEKVATPVRQVRRTRRARGEGAPVVRDEE